MSLKVRVEVYNRGGQLLGFYDGVIPDSGGSVTFNQGEVFAVAIVAPSRAKPFSEGHNIIEGKWKDPDDSLLPGRVASSSRRKPSSSCEPT